MILKIRPMLYIMWFGKFLFDKSIKILYSLLAISGLSNFHEAPLSWPFSIHSLYRQHTNSITASSRTDAGEMDKTRLINHSYRLLSGSQNINWKRHLMLINKWNLLSWWPCWFWSIIKATFHKIRCWLLIQKYKPMLMISVCFFYFI